MKICVINPGIPHGRIRAEALAEHFDEVHCIDTALTSGRTHLSLPGLFVYTDLARPMRAKGIKLKRLIDSIKPDGIVCHFASGYHYFDQVFWGEHPLATVAMGHDVLPEVSRPPVHPCYTALQRLAWNNSDFISAKSKTLFKHLRKAGITTPMQTNYWGLDLETFSPGDQMTARKALGLSTTEVLILSPRKMIRRCNIDIIIDAFAQVRKKFPHTRLLLLGGADQNYFNSLKKQIHTLGLENAVSLIEKVPQELLARYLQASDLVISLASSDGFSSTILETLACQKPLIAGETEQTLELLQHKVNALTCQLNASSLSEVTIEALKDHKLTEKIAINGRQTSLEEGDLRKNAKKFAVQFSDIIARCREKKPVWTYLTRSWFRLVYAPYFLINQMRKC